ncbi:hypothetical protein L5E57_31195, partial [Pseudomonas aeruginosa]|nr:hypothetical protein [Pseudomonas aeruginosa]
MDAIDDRPQPLLDLLRSRRSRFQERDSTSKGRDDLMEQISDHSAPGAPLELGKARDHLVVVRLHGDLNAWLRG